MLELPELPVALYDDDEDDWEFCSDVRNCCRMSATLVPDELLLLSVDDALSDDDEPW